MPAGRSTIHLRPEVLEWARTRARLDTNVLAKKIGVKEERITGWEETGNITFAQIRKLAHHTHTPRGFLYLDSPMDDSLPIDDFRTMAGRYISEPSVDLLETIHTMLGRQAWMRDERIEQGIAGNEYVGSLNTNNEIFAAADRIRTTLNLRTDWTTQAESWTEALTFLRTAMEESGILVFVNGIVGNNTHRKLDTEEFRGFALADDIAPLVFVNGADFRTAQIFTLAHELVHIFLQTSGVSNLYTLKPSSNTVERFCNKVAAEFLVPENFLRLQWEQTHDFQLLARYFKVSRVVVAIKALNTGLINNDEYQELWDSWYGEESNKLKASGGNFWNNQGWKIDPVFGQAVVLAAKSERLLYRDAYSLLGLKSGSFETYAERVLENVRP